MKYDLSTAEGRKVLREDWIAALRSGDYKQTKGKLRSRNGGMCCLGVLCEVAGLARKYDADDNDYDYYYDGENDSMMLPVSFANRFGINYAGTIDTSNFYENYENMKEILGNKILRKVIDAQALSTLNDEENLKFKDIADILEKIPEYIFKDNSALKD